jgi:hypothetical protein
MPGAVVGGGRFMGYGRLCETSNGSCSEVNGMVERKGDARYRESASQTDTRTDVFCSRLTISLLPILSTLNPSPTDPSLPSVRCASASSRLSTVGGLNSSVMWSTSNTGFWRCRMAGWEEMEPRR